MNSAFRKNNNNFYYIKELQWANRAAKLNSLYPKINQQSNQPIIDPIASQKEKSWNNRFVYSKIPNYDATKDKNVIDPNLLKIPKNNCYYNAIRNNNTINNPSSKRNIRGRIYKSNERTYLNCSNKNSQISNIISPNSSSKDLYLNNNINNRIISPFVKVNKNNNKNNNPDKLTKLWNDLCIQEPYRELFNLILNQLNEERKNDIYEREFNELSELKKNLQIVSSSVYFRIKTLEELSDLNDKLGLILKSKQTDSNEVVLKNISKKIQNLREYTVNICFAMKKIKQHINSHSFGKFEIDNIASKYKFDKNYLIKMKEEVCVLKEGYAKYFFNVTDDYTPFFLNTSEQGDGKNKNIDPFLHIVPMDDELKEEINQCIYIIYQELIGYQNINASQNNLRNISPLKKFNYNDIDIKIFKTQNNNLKKSFINNDNNNNFRLNINSRMKNSEFSPSRTSNLEYKNSVNNFKNKNKHRILSGSESMGNIEYNKYFNNSNTMDNFKLKINKNSNIRNNLQKSQTDKFGQNENQNYESYKSFNNIELNNNNNIGKDNEHEKDINKNNIIKNDELLENNNENNNNSYNDFINEKNELNNKNIEINNNYNNTNNEKNNDDKNNMSKELKILNKNDENEQTNKNLLVDNNNINITKNSNNEITNNNVNNKEKIINNKDLLEKNKISNKIINNNEDKTNINIEQNDENNINNNQIDIDINKNNNKINKDNLNNNIHKNNNNEIISENNSKNNDKYYENKSNNNNAQNYDNEKKEQIQAIDNNKNNNIQNMISPFIKSKKFKVRIFTEDINIFSKDFYNIYYQLIPTEIKDMFKIQSDIVPNLFSGISPYLVFLHEDLSPEQNSWINLRNNIFGMCTMHYKYKNSKLKIIINHISTSFKFNSEKSNNYLNDIKYIFSLIIKYIKKEFYFDEIIIEYDNNKINEDILNIFLNDLNFNIINENDIEDNKNNAKDNKLIYANDSTKNKINDMIRQTALSYLGKNIFNIFNSLLITNNTSSTMLTETNRTHQTNGFKKSYKYNDEDINLNNIYNDNLVNIVSMNYLLEVKEEININIYYNKLTKLDQLIKAFQKNEIKNTEIPLSIAENIFDILSCVINKTLINKNFSNSTIFNNYNTNNPCSYLDKNYGIFYNFIKPEKTYVLYNEKFRIKFYHIINNNMSLFICNINNDLLNYLNQNNIYIQINEIYKETISQNKKQILYNKILWIPCFEVYNHFKCLSSNSVGIIHEYIKISNKAIKKANKEKLKTNIKEENIQMRIEPDTSRDILFNNDFIFGIIDNIEILINKNQEEKNKDMNNEKEENNDNNLPYIIFLSYINKENFITNIAK